MKKLLYSECIFLMNSHAVALSWHERSQKNNILKPSVCRLQKLTTIPTNMIGSICHLQECRSIRVRNLTVTLLLCTTCMRSQLLGRVSGVVSPQTNKQTNEASPGPSDARSTGSSGWHSCGNAKDLPMDPDRSGVGFCPSLVFNFIL